MFIALPAPAVASLIKPARGQICGLSPAVANVFRQNKVVHQIKITAKQLKAKFKEMEMMGEKTRKNEKEEPKPTLLAVNRLYVLEDSN